MTYLAYYFFIGFIAFWLIALKEAEITKKSFAWFLFWPLVLLIISFSGLKDIWLESGL